MLIVDEINLRKSVAVSAKNLTYVGLTDMGNDSMPTSSDFSDLATHGLVVMFQSIADGSTQTIGVFASANAVAGNELAKILVQGISKLKNLVLKYMELFLMVPQRPEKCGRYWV